MRSDPMEGIAACVLAPSQRMSIERNPAAGRPNSAVIWPIGDKIATYTRRVKRWSGGKMMLRWVGAAILDAREGMRGVRGLKDMTILCNALERHEKTLHSGSEAA